MTTKRTKATKTAPTSPRARRKAGRGGVERFKIKRDPEVTIGRGTMLQSVVQADNRAIACGVVVDLPAGEPVNIARAILTAAGPRFRVLNTIVWLSPAQVRVEKEVMAAAFERIDNNAKAAAWAKWVNAGKGFTDFQSRVNVVKAPVLVAETPRKRVPATKRTVKPVVPTRNKSRNLTTLSLKSITMDKKQLRTLFSELTPKKVFNLTFIGDMAHRTGDWTVLKIRTGRGKGGSRLVDMVNAAGHKLTTGTPDSDKILNVTIDGTTHGHTSESDIPSVYEKNHSRAIALKETFVQLLPAEGDVEVTVKSTIDDYSGTFTVNKATRCKGRGGQIMLSLENVKTGAKVDLWSYRHSGIVTSFEITNYGSCEASTNSKVSNETDMTEDEEQAAYLSEFQGTEEDEA